MFSSLDWSYSYTIASFSPANSFKYLFGDSIFEILLNTAVWVIILYFGYRWMLQPAYATLKGVLNFWKLSKRDVVYLEITPPEHSEKSPLATEQLFTILQRLINKNSVLSLEIISSREKGIRYLISGDETAVTALQRHIAAYLPEVRFLTLNASPTQETIYTGSYCRVYEIKQLRHYAFPLQPHEDLSQNDPVTYLTGAMTKLKPGEAIVLQLVLAPHNSYWTRRLYNKILEKRIQQSWRLPASKDDGRSNIEDRALPCLGIR
jgi:hypothetical protein